MTDQVEREKGWPPPLWENPKPGQEHVLGTCARCTKVARILSEMSLDIKQGSPCGHCESFNASNVNLKGME